MSEQNVELVRQGFEAWNRRDLEWQLDRITSDFEWWTAQLFPDMEAVYRGPEGYRRFWNTFVGPWETLVLAVHRLEPIGDDRVLALVRFRGRGRDGIEVARDYASLFTVESGRFRQVVGFANWQQALEAAGLSE
jgi:ketosteroid isomerase-like protein